MFLRIVAFLLIGIGLWGYYTLIPSAPDSRSMSLGYYLGYYFWAYAPTLAGLWILYGIRAWNKDMEKEREKRAK